MSDSISRADAIGIIEDAINNEYISPRAALYMARAELTALPSAEAVQGWRIGKPTEQGEYMVTLDAWGHRYINIMYYAEPLMPNIEVDGMCWYRSDDEWCDVVYDDTDILAWIPLPKPYRKESEVEE